MEDIGRGVGVNLNRLRSRRFSFAKRKSAPEVRFNIVDQSCGLHHLGDTEWLVRLL